MVMMMVTMMIVVKREGSGWGKEKKESPTSWLTAFGHVRIAAQVKNWKNES